VSAAIAIRARTAVQNAVFSGALVRPSQCQACGKSGLKLHGHHNDYSKPLDVEWLCAKCHGAAHRRRNGGDAPAKPIGLRIDKRQAEAIDDWRRRQEDLPNKNEAIRRLIDIALQQQAAAEAPS
jgi:hypothetical protein